MSGLWPTPQVSKRDPMRNSTIIPKKKKCTRCGKDCIWFSRKMCEQCARIQNFHRNSERVTEKMIQEENLSSLIDQLDDVFSKYIRMSAADTHTGLVECYTCGSQKHYTLHQCGHFITRASLYLRWSENNVAVQCRNCNENLDGNLSAFSKRLEQDHPGRVDILEQDSTIAYRPTRQELREQIAHYTIKVKQLKNKLK